MTRQPKYPSLYADLDPASQGGVRGQRVRCSATGAPLGFVWWATAAHPPDARGTHVSWFYRAPDGTVGERTTERNAVQALRDRHARVQGGGGDAPEQPVLFDLEPRERPPARVAARRVIPLEASYPATPRIEHVATPRNEHVAPAPRPAPVVTWGEAAPGLVDALEKGLKGQRWS